MSDNRREVIIPAKKGEGGICFGPYALSFKEIVLVPYKIDQYGTIHVVPMAPAKCKGYKARMKRLVEMGVFTAEDLGIPKIKGLSIKKEVKNEKD